MRGEIRTALLLASTLTSVPLAGGEKPPAPLGIIAVRPADPGLTPHFILNRDGDGIGEELPSSIGYSAGARGRWVSMTVTDRRLCTRKDEKAICRAFEKLIDGPPPKLGTDVTGTRIGGSDYRTAYLVPLAGIDYPGVDRFVAFVGADSQDPPLANLVAYLYARKGTALIQLSADVAECNPLPREGESDEAYYRRNCVGDAVLRLASAKGGEAANRFRLRK